ncbi:4'-phosphopantetheinyl transferase family protein [Marinoscillum sp. MHG1-6]|uniref:4'-phosphopantetheinyl transferase family protein n=1 Tax=Marinoscillum sp. MHG1-6 TaxID=2959627 RepID=UPI002157C618|nr:4'-phosphopantetheinyl transferase family protein [Marinoscillum sp. MHG1-6]
MPLLLSKAINGHSAYAVWNIKETNEELAQMVPDMPPKDYKLAKQAEWMVGRILIQTLCAKYNIPYEGVDVEATGKPFLRNKKAEISITHSFPLAAALINLKSPCGIDLELPRHKLIQVREKFINGSEVSYADDLSKLCAIWCAKEVLYKIYSRKRLSLKDDTFVKFLSDQQILGTISKSMNGASKDYEIVLEEIKGYVLAYNT